MTMDFFVAVSCLFK